MITKFITGRCTLKIETANENISPWTVLLQRLTLTISLVITNSLSPRTILLSLKYKHCLVN